MQQLRWIRFALVLFVPAIADAGTGKTITGEPVDPSAYGPSVIETMAEVVARQAANPPSTPAPAPQHGHWVVPSRGAARFPHSGRRYITNKWGDTRMGIGFNGEVDVLGVYVTGQADKGVWTPGLRVIGYRDGEQVAQTELFTEIGAKPHWFAIDLHDVDRIVLDAIPAFRSAGWYGIDDLAFIRLESERPQRVTLDFEDLSFHTDLTGTDYGGLDWEVGTGTFLAGEAVPPPREPQAYGESFPGESATPPGGFRDTGTPPTVKRGFRGVIRGDANSWSYPPDTDGAVGPAHYVETVNRNFAVYDKASGAQLVNVHLQSFLPGSNGDPRILFDQHSGRWIVVVSDFVSRIYLAISMSDDPTGAWYKTSFIASRDDNQGCFPDYETLGVDEQGIYTSAYMANCGMTIFSIYKAPLLGATPYLGRLTAFRGLPFEGAIQPAHTYGAAPGEYFVSVNGSNGLRLRRLDGPLTAPTLTDLGVIAAPSFGFPPDAPALGSGTRLDTVGNRLMMAVYRNGSLWTAHTIAGGAGAAARWYEISTADLSLVQWGTVADPSLYFFFPSIMVNRFGDAVMGFTGSSSSQHAGAYFAARLANDPPGVMSAPLLLKAGQAPQNNIDSYGRNRWGDYSYTTLDPTDDETFCTLQEYAEATDIWGTWFAEIAYDDCNLNGTLDAADLAAGTSTDCDSNGRPDDCQLYNNDCNGDAEPDNCLRDSLIVGQPAPSTACPGDAVTFQVGTAGDGLTYQWRLDGVPLVDDDRISGAESPTLSISPVQAGDAGDYAVDVASGCVVAASEGATLIVESPPSIVTQPPATVTACAGAGTSIEVDATGTGPLRYQWYKDGALIPDGTSFLLHFNDLSAADAAEYHCVVSNGCASATSDPTELVVREIVIDLQPGSQCVLEGTSATFSAAAHTQGAALNYQWRKDGVVVPEVTEPTLMIDPVGPADVGSYLVIVFTTQPTCLEYSDTATLAIDEDSDGDTVPDCIDACPGFDDRLDCDTDGLPDGCETPGDTDNDGLVTMSDYGVMASCLEGPSAIVTASCYCTFDFDEDGDVDLLDFAVFARLFASAQ